MPAVFIICGLFADGVSSSVFIVLNTRMGVMSNELGKIFELWVVASFKILYPSICLEGLRNSTKIIAGSRTKKVVK
jgi:hypothetical protein